jgi:HEAT repeat protein
MSTSSSAALRATLIDLLSGYETPPAAAELQMLGAGVDVELMAISADVSVNKARRATATWALGYFPSDVTRGFLTLLVTDAGADSQLRRAATWALCNGWGDAALGLIGPALSASDPQLRNQAVRAVARVGTPAARAVLESRLAVESTAMVRDAITASLAEAK